MYCAKSHVPVYFYFHVELTKNNVALFQSGERGNCYL